MKKTKQIFGKHLYIYQILWAYFYIFSKFKIIKNIKINLGIPRSTPWHVCYIRFDVGTVLDNSLKLFCNAKCIFSCLVTALASSGKQPNTAVKKYRVVSLDPNFYKSDILFNILNLNLKILKFDFIKKQDYFKTY